ncbi:MAG: leucine-rich repeat domain-containing protein [Lachnospiraceae bacterium]|nr:leucine-rich repeat domain-containing protein [Lachnospiraceae bacterium]
MNRKIFKSLSALLLLTAIAVTQVPVSDVEAVTVAIESDFEMDGDKLMRYTGTAEVVSIPVGVKVIGEEAFAGNDHVIKVVVDEEVESIGYRAFADCDNLRTIVVGDGVEKIETAAFSNDKELVNVTLGAGVKSLGTGVFAGSSQLKELTLSEDNSYLHYSNGILYDDEETKVYALMPAHEKGAYTLPSTVREITGYAFWGNPYLERVHLGSGIYEIPAYAFSNCINLKEVVIPLTVRGIGAKAFEDCVNLTKVALPDSMMKISDTAFDGCPRVEFTATPGTYAAEYAAARETSKVEETEYEDVQDVQVIDPGVVSGEGTQSDVPAAHSTPAEDTRTPIPDAPVQEYEPVIEIENNQTLLGQSSIVSGRAVIFIDNRQPRVFSGTQTTTSRVDLSDFSAPPESTGEGGSQQSVEKMENLLADNAQKGKDFPKYTVVDDRKIASQAFYQNSELTEYEIEDGITEIGEFSFARSGLTSVTIPEGVTKIEYGAFYHCDSLTEVFIPDSVTEIEPYAFANTPWIAAHTQDGPFLIAGDGILIAYSGADSVVNIPDGVKQIGSGAFKEHMGITAVNIPDTVQVIGEEAFMNCRNLKTVNGGNHLVRIGDRAFMNCPLSKAVIPASVKEIGLGAYALSNGTDTVVFEGNKLPQLTMGKAAQRLANQEYRVYAFQNIRSAIIPDDAGSLDGTVLETGVYGFNGIVYGESGNQIADNRSGVDEAEGSGVMMRINSQAISGGENAMASIPGENGTYILKIADSEKAAENISAAYGELYGGKTPSGLTGYEISLYDASGSIPISRLGKQYINIQFKMPAGATADNLHIVTLDQDGQLEAVEHRIVALEDGDYIQITTSHFSPFGIYQYTSGNGQTAGGRTGTGSLSGNKDDTPDTGDFLHPKWFLALGLLAGSIALFFYKGKPKKGFN